MDKVNKGLWVALIASIIVWWFFKTEEPQAYLQEPTQQARPNKQFEKILFVEEKERAKNAALSWTGDAEELDHFKNMVSMKQMPIEDIRNYGQGAIPILTKIYTESSSNQEKRRIASLFWQLGWKSQQIEDALSADLDTNDEYLKIQVQWGIAKSTENSKVIRKLLENLENDSSALVRDKAACALASDFVHISAEQKFLIIEGLINSLDNPIYQVRSSSFTALTMHTGQTKGFNPGGTYESRSKSIEKWNVWLEEYRQSL